jgi:hypothetical protein
MDLPASNGWPVLYAYHGKIDADIVKLLKAAHAVQFGATTIPPIASGGSGWLWESGLCLNPCMFVFGYLTFFRTSFECVFDIHLFYQYRGYR